MNVYLYQNNTEKILKNAYIGEVWTPGSNTTLYYPFVDDQLDKVGGLTLPVTGTKQTIGYLFNTSQSWVQVHSSGTKFINFWINVQSINATKCLCGQLLSGYVFHYRNNNNSSITNRFGIFTGSGGSGAVTSNQVSMTTSAWHNICLGYDSNGAVGYLDGVKVFSTTSTPYSGGDEVGVFGTWSGNANGSAIVSEWIGESVVWTEQQVSNYYNNTKSNYGL